MAEEERRLKELQALTRSNAALRCLLSLQSRRSAAEPSRNSSGGDSPVPESSERYERLIEAVKLLREDLQLERKKAKLLLSRQMYADVARFVLFVAGSLAILTVFQPDFPSALRDHVCSEVDKLLGYSVRW
ncbi:hypothetical protein M758_2G224700 [Ceratodon purpureus]|nr:hypothetical protein M758_2G224700 [Ceratodon purpureus]